MRLTLASGVFALLFSTSAFAQILKEFPKHWGDPPRVQTRDLRDLPGDYGNGSSTLAAWIQQNLDKDGQNAGAQQGRVAVSGELKQWRALTLTVDGPQASETDSDPNPFTDYRFYMSFTDDSAKSNFTVQGYFAADGNAANTGATSGNKWRIHFVPDRPGKWRYTITFMRGKDIALEDKIGDKLPNLNGASGEFVVAPSDVKDPDPRARGLLKWNNKHLLHFAGSGEYFLKVGADAPETLLAYVDFDGTQAHKKNVPLKTWAPHGRDWRAGDPTWQNGKGKGLIGALNYLAGKGVNAFSFLTYNAGGDGDNVWPFVARDDKLHYDCSKLDQWRIVFDHATARGLFLHFKMQENELDDNRRGGGDEQGDVPESLDGGALGPERRLYCRELVARFGHELALNWNLGEENTQSPEEQRAMAQYIEYVDPYDHPIVIHTYPTQQDKVYGALLGSMSNLSGVSLQNSWSAAHERTLKWIRESDKAGRPWVVCNDEQNPASDGVPPDPGYKGHSGEAKDGGKTYTLDDIRKRTLWGTLMAGGAGVEYYFGYRLPENDLLCEDFRSRDRSWDYGRIAIDFFRNYVMSVDRLTNRDDLVGNPGNGNSRYCLAAPDAVYLVYLPEGGTHELDLTGATGEFKVQWFNPRRGGALADGAVKTVAGGGKVSLGAPPADAGEDWLVVARKRLPILRKDRRDTLPGSPF